MKRSSFSQGGFSLLEIMLVVMIIALLVGGAIRFLLPNLDFGKGVRIEGDLSAIATQLMIYENTFGALPSTQQGLRALVTQPDNPPRGWRQLMTDVPRDPYTQQEYVYESPGKHNPSGYDVYSVGKDKTPGTADDIGNWNK